QQQPKFLLHFSPKTFLGFQVGITWKVPRHLPQAIAFCDHCAVFALIAAAAEISSPFFSQNFSWISSRNHLE
ncbi:hypothetical protein ACH5RR_006862, partial [Cinchona calisaya]